MGKARKDDLFQPSRLLRDRLRDQRMSMPVDVDPPGRDGVQQPASVFRVEVDAFGARDPDGVRIKLRVREGMPDLQGLSRRLFENGPIEMKMVNLKKGATVDIREVRDAPGDPHLAVMLDGLF